jgi:hypothetical protein
LIVFTSCSDAGIDRHRTLTGDSNVENKIGSLDVLPNSAFLFEKYCLTTSASDKNPNLIATKLYNWKHIDGKSSHAGEEIAFKIVFKSFRL